MTCYQRRHDKWKSDKELEPAKIQAILDELVKVKGISARMLQKRHGTGYIGRIRKLKSLGYPIGRRREGGSVTWYLEQRSKRCMNCSMTYSYIPIIGSTEPEFCESCAQKLETKEADQVRIATEILNQSRKTEGTSECEEPIYRPCLMCGQSTRLGSFCSAKCAGEFLKSRIVRGELDNDYRPRSE
jgi:hypothetical protein